MLRFRRDEAGRVRRHTFELAWGDLANLSTPAMRTYRLSWHGGNLAAFRLIGLK
jgi:hypothetical protein